jgi:hypothetical protein
MIRQVWSPLLLILSMLYCFHESLSIAHANARNEATQTSNADDECGTDRRCRIERLKKRNQQRLKRRAVGNSRRLKKLEEKLDLKALKKGPRELRPYTIAFETMKGIGLDMQGLAGSWQWLEHFRLIGTFYPICEIHQYPYSYSYSYNNYLSGHCIKGGIRYLNGKSALTTYIDLYAIYMLLEGNRNYGASFVFGGYDRIEDPFGTTTNEHDDVYNEDAELEAHILGIGTGLDWQPKQYLHLRLGLSTHYVIFASVRDRLTRVNLTETNTEQIIVSDAMSITLDFSIGYAF